MNYNEFPKGRTIFVGVDPAAVNAIFSIVSGLRDCGWSACDLAIYTNEEGMFPGTVQSFVNRVGFSPEEVEGVLERKKPGLLFLGTSAQNHEAVWIAKAKDKGIRTISFVDHWVNMHKRFLSSNGRVHYPDQVWVLNELAYRQALKEGLPAEILRVERNPHYKYIEDFRPEISIEKFRETLQLKKARTILFVSDGVRASLPDIGFDEFSVLRQVLTALSRLMSESPARAYDFLIKLHPRCRRGKYDEIISEFRTERLSIREISDYSPNILNYYADYVIGMFSNMVVEALLMRKKVLRVEIGRNRELLMFDELDCKVVTEETALIGELRVFLEL